MRPRLDGVKMLSERNDAHGPDHDTEWMAMIPTLALVVTGSGSQQDGLVAIATTVAQIHALLVAEEVPRALKMIGDHRPALVLLDMTLLGEEAGTVLKQITAEYPSIGCIILADDVQQQREAEAAGVGAVLIKGYPAGKLIEAIESLLPQEEIGGVCTE
jgi:DNA-binding NarL/FixJ family response regulator